MAGCLVSLWVSVSVSPGLCLSLCVSLLFLSLPVSLHLSPSLTVSLSHSEAQGSVSAHRWKGTILTGGLGGTGLGGGALCAVSSVHERLLPAALQFHVTRMALWPHVRTALQPRIARTALQEDGSSVSAVSCAQRKGYLRRGRNAVYLRMRSLEPALRSELGTDAAPPGKTQTASARPKLFVPVSVWSFQISLGELAPASHAHQFTTVLMQQVRRPWQRLRLPLPSRAQFLACQTGNT